MDLEVWAQLNLIGHVSYSEYLAMTPEEAMACLHALNRVIEKAKQPNEEEILKQRMKNALEETASKFNNRNGR